jgi:mRNA interferase HigB
MHIISKHPLQEFWLKYPDAESPLRTWHKKTKDAKWRNFAHLRENFSTADQVGDCTVFNVGGNKYRLIARVNYQTGRVYVRYVLTHAEYDRGGWKDDCQ